MENSKSPQMCCMEIPFLNLWVNVVVYKVGGHRAIRDPGGILKKNFSVKFWSKSFESGVSY